MHVSFVLCDIVLMQRARMNPPIMQFSVIPEHTSSHIVCETNILEIATTQIIATDFFGPRYTMTVLYRDDNLKVMYSFHLLRRWL